MLPCLSKRLERNVYGRLFFLESYSLHDKQFGFHNKIPLNMTLFTLKMKLEFFRSAFKIFTQSNTFFTKKYKNGDDKSEMSSLEKFHTKTTNKKLHT